jgi:penicillin-binding protein 1A
VVYAAALEAGMRPDSRVDDTKITVDGWTPVNYDGRYRGRMRMDRALARSLNAAAVRLQERVGRGRVIDVARRLGIASTLKPVASLALGSAEVGVLELTAAYLPFITKGLAARPYGIIKVETGDGRVLYRRGKTTYRRALEPGIARDMRRMLEGAVANGTGRRAALPGITVGGKTGTSQANRDAWFIGFTGDTVAGIWFGNDDDSPMRGVAGGGLPARTWKRFMIGARRAAPIASRATDRIEPGRGGDGAGLLGRVADAVIDGLFGSEPQDGADAQVRENAKGILRWLIDAATSGSPPDSAPGSEELPEDFGK